MHPTQTTRPGEQCLTSQLELGIQPLKTAETASPDSRVFYINDDLEMLRLGASLAEVFGANKDKPAFITDCAHLSAREKLKLTKATHAFFSDSAPNETVYLRLAFGEGDSAQAACLTLDARKADEDEPLIRCQVEMIAAASPRKDSRSLGPKSCDSCAAWTFDPRSDSFKVAKPEQPDGSQTLDRDAWIDSIHPDYRESTSDAFRKFIGGETHTLDIHYKSVASESHGHLIRTLGMRIDSPSSDEPLILGTHQVESPHASTVDDLKLFSHLARKVKLSILVSDPGGHIKWCNNAFSETTGYELHEVVGTDPSLLLAGPLSETSTLQYMRDRMRKGKAFHTEIVQYKKNGAPYWVRIDGTPLMDDAGQLRRFISFQTDITESKKSQNAILRSEIKFRSLFDNSNDALLLLSPKDGVVIEANQSAAQILGTDRIVGQRLEEIFPETSGFQIEHLHELLESDEGHQRKSGEFITEGGAIRPIEMTVSRTPIGEAMALLVTLRDISEKKQLEEQLRHAQRMEAVGQLAGGIAHDFNNLLAGQRGFSELLCASGDLSKKDHAYAKEILKITDRARKLTSRLLSFSRGKSETPVVADLNHLINNILPMLSRILRQEVSFLSDLDPDLSNVKVDTNQIEQVIMNLVVNGQEAICEQGGTVELTSEMTDLDGTELFITGKPNPGRYAKVTVRDDGQGIPHSVLEKIFEPFFTTKKGAGTGLGLSIVYGIIQSNGGHLMVDSVIGTGTQFSIYFPEVHEEAVHEELPDLQAAMPEATTSEQGVTPTILVAEDQDQVREILELGLGQSGYNLIVAKNGREAIELGLAHQGRLDLILTDSIMPGASGKTVITTLRETRPDVKVVFMSGLPIQESEGIEELKVDAYVDKPFSIRDLLKLIEELVGAKAQ